MRAILITGISGFVGSNLSDHLLHSGEYTVYGHSRTPGDFVTHVAKGIRFVDDLSIDRLNELKIESIVHLAGIAHDLHNRYSTADYYRVNTEATKNIFDLFLNSNASRFIVVSSIKAVCDIAASPSHEEVTPTPKTDYGKSKLKAEEYIRSNAAATDKHYYILRPAMIHGPGNKGNLNLLYKFVRSGVPWPLSAFDNQRSFLSIGNFNFIVDRLLTGKIPSGVYHLADSSYISTTDLVKQIGLAMNKKIRVMRFPRTLISVLARLTGQQARLDKLTESMMVSNSKILTTLGQELPVTLKEGIRKTIRSFHE
jgi:nucleoside-diphosphate-sugar epimerase